MIRNDMLSTTPRLFTSQQDQNRAEKGSHRQTPYYLGIYSKSEVILNKPCHVTITLETLGRLDMH